MNPIKATALRTRNFVTDHKVALTAVTSAATTAVVMVKLQAGTIKQVNEFLKEKGLYEEFHNRFNDLNV